MFPFAISNSIDASPLHRVSRALSNALNVHKNSFCALHLFCFSDGAQALLNDCQWLYCMQPFLSQSNQHRD